MKKNRRESKKAMTKLVKSQVIFIDSDALDVDKLLNNVSVGISQLTDQIDDWNKNAN